MRPGPVLSTAFALAACVAAQPAAATTFEFFEGNNCTQDKLGGTNTIVHLQKDVDTYTVLSPLRWKFAGITTSNSQPWSDEARSVLITSNWKRQREPRTARIVIYDSPDASRGDDWVAIVVRNAEEIPANGLCVGTFDRPFDRGGVFLERHPKNGLDGKISFIASHCAVACRANLTTDPNPPPKPRIVIKRDPDGKKMSPEAMKVLKRRREQ